VKSRYVVVTQESFAKVYEVCRFRIYGTVSLDFEDLLALLGCIRKVGQVFFGEISLLNTPIGFDDFRRSKRWNRTKDFASSSGVFSTSSELRLTIVKWPL
jgi:hypothetical protein